MKKVTLKRARELISYDPSTGSMTWRRPVGSRAIQGTQAGALRSDGYRVVKLDGEQVMAHRLAWFIHYGRWPKNQIDHVNRDRQDNRMANLRDVLSYMNQQNMRVRSDNSTGFTGVHRARKGRFRAQLCHRGKTYSGGVYDTPEEAHAAYLRLKAELHTY